VREVALVVVVVKVLGGRWTGVQTTRWGRQAMQETVGLGSRPQEAVGRDGDAPVEAKGAVGSTAGLAAR
jgi:hypothetical protein